MNELNAIVEEMLQAVNSKAASIGPALPLTAAITGLEQTLASQSTVVKENTRATSSSTNRASGTSVASEITGSLGLGSGLGIGFGLGPLFSGIASLFGGSGSSQPTPLPVFSLPAAVNATAGVSGDPQSGVFGGSVGQGGTVRPDSSGAGGGPPAITVQVQAMDSQSFLDRSSDIAMAVRQAMLQTGILRDVIQEV